MNRTRGIRPNFAQMLAEEDEEERPAKRGKKTLIDNLWTSDLEKELGRKMDEVGPECMRKGFQIPDDWLKSFRNISLSSLRAKMRMMAINKGWKKPAGEIFIFDNSHCYFKKTLC
jgi:hypothetical protein